MTQFFSNFLLGLLAVFWWKSMDIEVLVWTPRGGIWSNLVLMRLDTLGEIFNWIESRSSRSFVIGIVSLLRGAY